MNLVIADDYDGMSLAAADWISSFVRLKPDATIALTTGNTPIGCYRELSRKVSHGEISFRNASFICTEEYLGVSPSDKVSLYGWLKRSFMSPCSVHDQQVCRMEGESAEPQQACEQFSRHIHRLGGLDLVIEGIGRNGHIGFNEPGSFVSSRARIVELAAITQQSNFHYWNEEVPRYGLTIGMAELLESRHILLLASGEDKAIALQLALEGISTEAVPASLLQNHSNLTVIVDQAAASRLRARERDER
jgi:glucosamine-6-phosphate deaminase